MSHGKEESDDIWIVAGFLFGIIGWVIALSTDGADDGRASKALWGCFIWGISVAFMLAIAYGL